MKTERILQSQGFGSRKECRALIEAGLFSIDGEVIDDPGLEVNTDGLQFAVDDQPWTYRDKAYLVLHKPPGYECSRKPTFHPSIYRLLPPQFANRDIQPVGRLDQDTTGLLLLSDDGQFIHFWSSGKKRVPKTYEIVTSDVLTDGQLQQLLAGVQLDDEPAPIAALACERRGERALAMTVTEGKYHQVKRMLVAAGNNVAKLHRSRVGGLSLPDDLSEGNWRWLEAGDLDQLARYTG